MEESMVNNSAAGGLSLLFQLGLIVLIVIGMWRVFSKAAQPGWAVLIPIYNTYVMLKIADKPGWWLLLMFIPIVNVIIYIITLSGISTGFGKGIGFTIGLFFLPFIFFPILGFSEAEYQCGLADF